MTPELAYVLEELALADDHATMVALLLNKPTLAKILWNQARIAARSIPEKKA
jgi:hypothetical protein